MHLICTVASIWIPLAAPLTPANEADNLVAPALIEELPPKVRFLLGDTHYNTPEIRELCEQDNRFLVASRPAPYPHDDIGVKVRQISHQLRSKAIEPFNSLFKNVFEWNGQVPVRGLNRTSLIVLGAVLVYQIVLLYQFDQNRPIGCGVKPLLRAA